LIQLKETENPLKSLIRNHFFNRGRILQGFWALILAIFLWLAFFSFNPYFKFPGMVGALATFFYLLFLRGSIKQNSYKNPQRTHQLFSLVEDIEETGPYFMEGKNKERDIGYLKKFFSSFLETQEFILFLKQDNSYRFFDLKSENVEYKKRTIKIDGELDNFLRRFSKNQIIDLSVKNGYSAAPISALKQFRYRAVVPLKVKYDLAGLVFFSSGKRKLNREEEMFLYLISNKLLWLEENRKLKGEFQKERKKYLRKSDQDKNKVSLNEVEMKKKIFDLHSLTQVANQLYLSLNQNRLFYNFTQSIQKQLNSKSVLIFLPDSDGENLKARFSKGVDFTQFTEIGLRKNDPLYGKFKKEQFPFYLYSAVEENQDNELLALLISQELQLCYPLKLPDNKLGLVFLGGKVEGLKYRENDFMILSFLEDVLSSSLKNIDQYKKLEELSYTDSLSGLYNRQYFLKRLNEEIFRAKRYQRNLALVIFDIDEFKTYNDSFGHQSGDQIIKQLGEEIIKVVRSIDVVCRYGGDEFCIIIPETNQEECSKFLERLRRHIQQHIFDNELLQIKHHLTLSAGAAIYPQHARFSEKLIYCADMALLKAKKSGRNKTNMYSGETIGLRDSVSL